MGGPITKQTTLGRTSESALCKVENRTSSPSAKGSNPSQLHRSTHPGCLFRYSMVLIVLFVGAQFAGHVILLRGADRQTILLTVLLDFAIALVFIVILLWWLVRLTANFKHCCYDAHDEEDSFVSVHESTENFESSQCLLPPSERC